MAVFIFTRPTFSRLRKPRGANRVRRRCGNVNEDNKRGAGFRRGRTFSETSWLAFDVDEEPVAVPDAEEHVGDDAYGGRADHRAGDGRLEQSANQQVHVVDGCVQHLQLFHVLNKGLMYVIDLRNQPRFFCTRLRTRVPISFASTVRKGILHNGAFLRHTTQSFFCSTRSFGESTKIQIYVST